MSSCAEPLVFACLAPHGWLTIPILSGPEVEKAAVSRAALEELGRRLAQARPDTLVVVTPHGLMVEGHVSLLDTPEVSGDTFRMPWVSDIRHGFRLAFAVDRDLNAGICGAAERHDVPVVRVVNQAAWEPLLLDFGALIPLWHLGANLIPRPQVVVGCADRGGKSVSGEACYRLGRAIRDAAGASGRRVALIASGDLGHAHDAGGPYGLDPASADFDAAVVDALKAGDLASLRGLDPAFVKQAKTDAYGPLLTLHGAVEGTGLRANFLSYEVPAYFGMACAAFAPEP